ncbi:MAG: class I SAM-dependent methyltransferase [Clostridia bacterium]|nr:class I SAM-dependent methyltransferase [Clostridia bacterium]
MENKIVVCYADESFREKAENLAKKLNTEIKSGIIENELTLLYDERGLTLTDGDLEVRGDFAENRNRLSENNLRQEFLVKAVKSKNMGENPLVVDATAGLGEDSILLAAAGYRVIMFEYNPVICALLEDAMDRAKETEELREIIKRMTLVEGDSTEKMSEINERPEAVFLDPMFPERKKSALVKKKFQLLQRLEKPATDEREMYEEAVKLKPKKIVIKRPLKGPTLEGTKPSYSIKGKAIRYDCILL